MNVAENKRAVRGARIIANAYAAHEQLDGLPDEVVPRTLSEAYATQEELVQLWGGKIGGWKLSCTSGVAQKALGFYQPCFGRVMSGKIKSSPATLPGDHYFMRLIEPEFGFKMKKNLPASDEPFELVEVLDAVEALVPVIEIVDCIYNDWSAVGVHSLIADNMLSGGLVVGTPFKPWRNADLQSHKVTLTVNNKIKSTGSGANVLGNPLNALLWLANELVGLGSEIRAGDVVATGLATGLVFAEPGDRVVADFGSMGKVVANFS